MFIMILLQPPSYSTSTIFSTHRTHGRLCVRFNVQKPLRVIVRISIPHIHVIRRELHPILARHLRRPSRPTTHYSQTWTNLSVQCPSLLIHSEATCQCPN